MSQGKKKKLLVLCPFPEGVAAGQRLKYEQYFDDWRDLGWEIEVSSFMDLPMWQVTYQPGKFLPKIAGVLRGHFRRLRDLLRVNRYDAVYVFMWVTPFGTSIMERLVRWQARRLMYDVEDNVLVEQNLPKEYNPNALLRILKGPGKTRFLIRTADHVIASSPFLRDFCLQSNAAKKCTYISSSIDTDRFLPVNAYNNDATVTIGWTGTFSSRIYLDVLRNMFQTLAQRVDFRLRIIGNFPYDLPGVNLDVIQWSSEREVEDLQGIDIGIYPLPNDDWVLGKSGLKAIQYMAFGLPTVASNAGMTPKIIESGKNGILVTNEAEWLDALEQLIANPALRQKMGKAARQNAEEKYSLAAVKIDYQRVLDDVMRERE